MTALWTREELEAATGGRLIGAERPIGGASIDTRTLQPGDLFFAIRGEARDGHDFVADALGRGAGAAVVARPAPQVWRRTAPSWRCPKRVADPVLTAMVRLGAAARARTRAQVVAVTGSVGKTGTKEALRHVLSGQGETHASAASYNNHWGVPLTLARMPGSTRYGVFEIGMNHGAEIVPLTAQVRPDIALITTVEPVHIEHFASLAAIADAKGEIFSGLRARRRGDHQSRRPAFRPARRPRAGVPGGAGGQLRRASGGRRARPEDRAAPRPVGGRRGGDGPARYLQARHGRPARGTELARRHGGGPQPRRRPRPGRPVARRADAAGRARRAHRPGDRRRHRLPRRRELQRQSRRGPGGAGDARRHRDRPARAPHRGAGRHAGTRRRRAPTCIAASPRRSRPRGSTSSSRPVR